jgi:hypothetical protein
VAPPSESLVPVGGVGIRDIADATFRGDGLAAFVDAAADAGVGVAVHDAGREVTAFGVDDDAAFVLGNGDRRIARLRPWRSCRNGCQTLTLGNDAGCTVGPDGGVGDDEIERVARVVR